MKINWKKIICIGLGTLGLPAGVCAAGTVISGGGSIIGSSQNPWFVGRSEFTYCIQSSLTFSKGIPEASEDISSVLSKWTETLKKLTPVPTKLAFLDGKTKNMTLKFRKLSSCDSDVDLTFKLGVVDSSVRQTLGDFGSSYVGFAKRTEYSEKTGWTKGFIWVAPDLGPDAVKKTKSPIWSQNVAALHNVLLHEVGHVFGFQHDIGALMNEKFPESIVGKAMAPSIPEDTGYYGMNYLFERYLSKSNKKQCWKFEQGYGGLNYEQFLEDIFGTDRKDELFEKRICLDLVEGPFPVLTLETLQGRVLVSKELARLYTIAEDTTGPKSVYPSADKSGNISHVTHNFIELFKTNIWGLVDGKKLVNISAKEGRVEFISANGNASYLFTPYQLLTNY